MKFTAVAIIALATGAFALPGRQGPPPHKPEKPSPPIIKDNNNNNQNNVCGNGQSLYCCNNEGGKSNNVICASLSNGGLGGVCNGIQVCCNSNNGNQGCNIGNGGGTIIFKNEGGHRLI
ncbi:hypothetical protein ACLX1H_006023 [Fusarium chlamydosporum]